MKPDLPQVVVRVPVPEGALEPLAGLAQVVPVDASVGREALLDALAHADAFMALLGDRVDAELLAAAPKLQIVANMAVGIDNIDLAAARERQIWVTNTPDVLTDATADLTWGLILAVTRRLHEAEDELRAGRFRGWSLTYMLGAGLQGKTLGIVGFGRIGRAVARRALAFGMRVIYSFHDERAKAVPSTEACEAVPLRDLLQTSDIVSLHLPLTPGTYHLMDASALALMRPGSFLINAARGPVVDELALAQALSSGKLAGAGLDVYENEPLVSPALLASPNAVLLPHIGSATRETRSAMVRLAAENVAAALSGREPRAVVVRP